MVDSGKQRPRTTSMMVILRLLVKGCLWPVLLRHSLVEKLVICTLRGLQKLGGCFDIGNFPETSGFAALRG
jgi:hypothetical protein